MPSIWHMLVRGLGRVTDCPGPNIRDIQRESHVPHHSGGKHPPAVGPRTIARCSMLSRWRTRGTMLCLPVLVGIVALFAWPSYTAAQEPAKQPAAAAEQPAPPTAPQTAPAKQTAETPAASQTDRTTETQTEETSPAKGDSQPAATSDDQPASSSDQGAPGEGKAPPPPEQQQAPSGTEPTAEGSAASQPQAAVQESAGTASEQQPAESAPEETTGGKLRLRSWLQLLVAVLVLVGAVGLGNFLAKRWRMPDYANKFTIILLAIFGSAAITVMGWPPRRGIDLRGGVYLIYEFADTGTAAGTSPQADAQASGARNRQPVDVDKLVQAINRRINPGGVKEVTVRPLGERQIEVIIPEADREEVERIKKKISAAGTLEFRILANNRDHASLIEQAMKSDRRELRDADGNLLAWWVPVTKGQEESFASYGEIAKRKRKDRRSGYEFTEILVVKDPFDVTGAYLVHSRPGYDRSGSPCVFFTFNREGGQRFGGLTGKNRPEEGQEAFTRKLGIILDGYLYSAPAIKDTITTNGEITGRFTRKEVEDLVDVLNAGSLPTRLSEEPVSENLVGPTLGRDTIRRGQQAIMFSMILVPLFMVFYYRFAGLVACFALFLTLTLVLAAMITIKAAFTLPGLAGLVLTVGMAVDANVIIYERIREELDRGAALRMAIRNGFSRALSAIVDANLTTLITATVLYVIGRDQIKGFAVTLWLGVVMSMFAAIYCARVIFDVAERRRWITELRMLRVISNPRIRFMEKAPLAMAVSGVLILIGLFAVVQRGKGILDIDFTGGVSIEAEFVRPQDIGEIRAKLGNAGEGLQDLAISDVRTLDNPMPGHRFMINTSGPRGMDPDASPDEVFAEVEKRLKRAFGNDLVHYSMDFEIVSAGDRTGTTGTGGEARMACPGAMLASGQTGNRPALSSTPWGSASTAAMVFAQAEEAAKPQESSAEEAPQSEQSETQSQPTKAEKAQSGEQAAAPAPTPENTVAKLHFKQQVVLETIEQMFHEAIKE